MTNPYLAFDLLIQAGLDGIHRNLKPMKPLDVNLYKADRSITDTLRRIPDSFDEAVNAARQSDFIRQAVPEGYIEEYSRRKQVSEL
jgi:glutamine synthetase